MTKPASPLGQLARGELEFLRKAIARRQVATPLTAVGLEAIGKGQLAARLGPLAGAGEEVALALIDLALAAGDAAAAGAPAAAGLVWSAPPVDPSPARPTTAVVLELLGGAQAEVLVAGYEFDHGAVVFGPLHQAMTQRAVKARIFLDVRPVPSPKANVAAHLALETHRFLKRNWPFGPPFPQLFYLAAGCAHGSRCSLHAKCVVVDGRHVLVGSANFTKRGHTRNLEVGVRLDDAALAAALTRQLDHLVETGELAPLPVAARLSAPPAAAEDEAGEVVAVAGPSGGAFEALAAELLVSQAATGLFIRLMGAGAPAPRVGEDIEGDDGEVLGSPELSWDAARVAVLLPEQEGSRKKLLAAGWTCFPVTLGDDELGALCELVRREG